jgi:multiple sugar transport system substrate-binding protein
MLIASFAFATAAFATAAFADTMTMWVRASGADAAAHLVNLWNATDGDKIELATIPDNQMVTKLATGVQAGVRFPTSCHSTSYARPIS